MYVGPPYDGFELNAACVFLFSVFSGFISQQCTYSMILGEVFGNG